MELKLTVNVTHLGENIFSIKLPKFSVHTALIAYTNTLVFFLRQQIIVMGIITMGISGEKKILKTVSKRKCLYFILIILPQNPVCFFFFPLNQQQWDHPRKNVNQSHFSESVKPLQATQAEDPESSAAVAAFPRVQTLGLSAAVCSAAAGSLPPVPAAPRGVSAVHVGGLARINLALP